MDHTLSFNEHIILCTDCKGDLTVSPMYDVEETNHRYLRKAIRDFAKNGKLQQDALMKTLFHHTYHRVASILVHYGAQHLRDMKITARTAIKLKVPMKGDVRAVTTACTVSELLDLLPVEEDWGDTGLLEEIVNYLPNEARKLALGLLKSYNVYLMVYNEGVPLQMSLTKDMTAPGATKARLEVTVCKDMSEFTCKDCIEMLDLLLNKSYEIPRMKSKVNGVFSGSTTVVFLIDKTYTENVLHNSVEASALWAFQELRVTRVRIDAIEFNVVQLLTQHFKEALRNGLTSGMDFVGATKVCAC